MEIVLGRPHPERIAALSLHARHLWYVADRARLPYKGVVLFPRLVSDFGFGEQFMWDCFEELSDAGVVPSQGVTTVIPFEGERPYVGRPSQALWKKLRARVFARDGFICQYCGVSPERPECDHVVPVARGGSNDIENLVTSCWSCNNSKRDKLLSEWRR